MRILLLGSVGSGKTTQADILCRRDGFAYIRSGDLVREEALKDTPLGKICKEALSKGELVADQYVIPLVKAKIKERQLEGFKDFVFDGYIRSLSQLKTFNPEYDLVIYLRVPEMVVKERLLKRERSDDVPGVIEKRLEVYKKQTQPLVTYFKNQGNLREIDAAGSVDEVASQIEGVLKQHGQG